MEHVDGIHNAIISTHCHNDLGMATANTMAGVLNGARQVEVTINGIGERAGNAALEEVAVALNIREDYYQATSDIVLNETVNTAELVSRYSGIAIPKLLLVGMPFLMNLVSTKMVSLKILLLMKSLHPSWLGLRKAHFHLVNCQVAMPLLKN